MDTDDGGPAFPTQDYAENGLPLGLCERGMSLRDYFAGQALMGIIANPSEAAGNTWDDVLRELATVSYQYADAMLAERSKSSSKE